MKDVVGTLKGMIKNEDKYERMEGFCILSLIGGVVLLSAGTGLTLLSSKGIPAIMAILGSLFSFLSTVALIFVWLIREYVGE